MKTLKLKSILFGLMAVLAIAVVMTSCEQDAISNLKEEASIGDSDSNIEAGQSCSGCMMLYSHEEPDEIVDVLIKYSEDGEPVVEKAARYGEVVVYGGDVVLTDSYSTEISLRGNITSNFSARWPNSTIPYVWGAGLSAANRADILTAIETVNAQTNLCIVERTDEVAFVQFRNTETGCFVRGIGSTGAANQEINLSAGCFSQGTIIHEILHKAGFFHEQTRPDRDDFITVNWANLQPGNWTRQFQPQGPETNSGTYDFASLMHYPQFHPDPTIDDTQPMYFIDDLSDLPTGMTANQIGRLQDMSATDIASVNTLYPIACGGTPPANCEILTNGGFDSNVSNWQSWGCNAYSSGGTANITSISTGANVWDAAFRQIGTTMQQGKTYTVTFRARANSNRSMTLKAGMHVSPWTSYLYETVNLTTSMQNYSYTFTMSNATNTDASVEFYFANNSSNIYIDNVSLEENGCGGGGGCPAAGTSCDDGNSATYNDQQDGNCNCVGTPCPSAGTSCDDGNPNTINDQQDGNCNCVGTSCPSAGTPCDDGNPNTINDVQDGFCNCAGTPVQTGNCELVANGGFDSNLSNWESWGCNAYSSNGTANLTSITTGANIWDAALMQTGVRLQQGKTYTVTFRARANSNRSMTLKTGMYVSPWTSYLYETVNLTTSMRTYTYTFTMSNATNTDSSIEFFFGTNSPSIYIENVSLKENGCGGNNCPSAGTPCDDGNPNTANDVEDGNCNCAGTPIQPSNCEVLSNGGFDSNLSNWDSWNCNASASGGVANVTGISTGANPWDAGLNQVGFTMEQGKTYTVTFRARAANNRSIVVKTGITGAPWTSYLYETVNLTTSMQTYTITFTMDYPTDTNARFEFFFGTNSPNVYIDNVSMSSDC